MAGKKASIGISIIADATKARAGFAEAEKAAGSLNNQMKRVGKSIAGAFATRAIFSFASGALKAAEAANTSQQRISQVATSMGLFGDNVAGVTERLTDLADQTARNTGIDQDQIKLTQAKLLTFAQLAKTADKVGGAFDRATMAAIDMAAAGFGEASTNAVQLGKALQDPIKGITALGRSGITFTDQQREVIKSLVETNKMGEAQALILDAIEQQIGGVAEATANDTDKMRVSYKQLQQEVGEALVPVFASLLDVVQPIIAAFASLPDGVQKTITIVVLAASSFKALSVTLQGVGLAAGTANKALGAVGLALTAAVTIYTLYNRGKKEATKRTEDFVDALNEESGAQNDAVDKHIAAILANEDLADVYAKLGFTIQDMSAIIQGESNPAFDRLVERVNSAFDGTGDLLIKQNDLADEYGVTGAKLRIFVGEILGQETALASARDEIDRNTQAQEDLGIETDRARIATEELTASLEEQEQQMQAVVDATLAAFSAQLGYESQTWATSDAISAYNDLIGDVLSGAYEGADVFRDLAKAENEVYEKSLQQAAGALRLAEETAAAAGEQLTAADAARIQADELGKIAQTLGPNDPLRRHLAAYIEQLLAIPKGITTTIGSTIVSPGGIAGGRATEIEKRAAGGPVVAARPYLVGEAGPELFVPGQSGAIVPNSTLIDSFAGGGGRSMVGGDTIVVNVAGTVVSERDLVEAVRRGLQDTQRSGRNLLVS